MKKKRKGFTLIELIIVIAILAILVAVAVPKYSASREKAAITAHNTNVRMLQTAASTAIADGLTDFTWTGIDSQDAKEYIEKWPEIPNGIKQIKEKSYEVTVQSGKITVKPDEIKTEGGK
ncbi:MAG: prepilin-type N-terminal cleavage/methylation domain-containing protein [Peptoniphilaceae bacterium]|nr:prepilin-type N-terminal cleavage/methylation domain-containing protein [Peptoniphilaceae bacterium]